MTRLFITGASGHGREVASVLNAAAAGGRALGEVVGFIDDDAELHGQIVNGLPVLGGLDLLASQSGNVGAVLGVGYPEVKLRIARGLPSTEISWPAVVHPGATIGGEVRLGRGAFVQAGTVLSVNIDVGDFVTVNLGATVSHDCTLGPFSTVSPGASLGGRVSLGEGAFIGIGATVIQNVSIGPWSVVGAGAVVVKDVPPNAVVVGVPARVIKTRPEGWQHG